MHWDLLDLGLAVVALAFAVSGYRQGFVVGALSFIGFIGGGVLGAKVSPGIANAASSAAGQAIIALVVVLFLASIGQYAAATAGVAVRRRLVWRPVRAADSAAGAAISIASVLLVAWLVGTAAAHAPFPRLAKQVRHSQILGWVDDAMPDGLRSFFAAFRRLVQSHTFPQVFGSLGPEHIVPVAPPDPALANSRVVVTAHASVVKVVGVATSCSRRLEGTAFFYAPHHLITNAHVVAGVRNPHIVLENGDQVSATIVLYDPRTDIAVLDVPDANEPALAFAGVASTGDPAIVLGYPEDGPYTPVSARIRTREEARGPDIYQNSQVTREIYSIYARVLPGDSGGPLLAPNGHVYGVVFAAAADDPNTGYALTARQVAADAGRGAAATSRVSSGGCD